LRTNRSRIVVALAVTAVALSACGGSAATNAPTTAPATAAPATAAPATAAPATAAPTEAAVDWKTATSAGAGGVDAVCAAAKTEGQLNVIALPPEWANYGQMITDFEAKYGIKVNSAQPDANSQQEIDAANQLAGTGRQPDTFDLGTAVMLANTSLYAPYQVATWSDIPDGNKDPNGVWTNNYMGFMSIGYDSSVGEITKVADLADPKYKGKVALNGDPLKASAGFNGVVMASLANGGSADNIAPGVDFFKKLADMGNLLPVDPTPATIASGQTPIVIDWGYNNGPLATSLESKGITWKTIIPSDAPPVGAFYNATINKDAAHPAAARCWQEYLFSDAGQNTFLKGYALPVRAAAMTTAGTIDQAAAAALNPPSTPPVILTDAQTEAAKTYLTDNWKFIAIP
jgi:putative spermidine/putrescine transport system substrate-binding protein